MVFKPKFQYSVKIKDGSDYKIKWNIPKGYITKFLSQARKNRVNLLLFKLYYFIFIISTGILRSFLLYGKVSADNHLQLRKSMYLIKLNFDISDICKVLSRFLNLVCISLK